MKFIQLVLRRPMSIITLILGVVVFGSASLTGMPLEYMPDMEMPMELVMITWPGADADSVDRLLTQPMEDECESLSDLDSINSYSSENYTMLQLTYQYGTDMDDAYSDLKSAIDNLMPSLPDECGDPIIMEISADALGTMMISATAPAGIDVADYLDNEVVPALENIGGVARVELSGARDEYLRIVLDEAAMRQYGLSISTVGSAIAAADFDMPVGSVSLGSQDIALGVYGNVEVNPNFRDLPIQTPSGHTVMLEDICTFFNLYEEDADTVSRYNGQESVMLTVTKQDSAATMEVCNAVQDVLDQYSVDGVGFETIYSEGDSILETLGEVLNTLITGVILTMIVLFVFFGDLRASLIVGISMPLSILLAVILLNFAGFQIDLMTGSALIIAIGMIVDNSIVVLESCMRCKEEGLDFREAAATGTATMLMSILAGTLTTVVVYIPMAMADGLVGMMTGPLSWTILLTLLCSFLCAVVVVPLAFLWLKPRTKDQLITNRILDRFKGFYRRTLPRLLRHPGRVVLVGGTGLWLDALISGRTFAPGQSGGAIRRELEQRFEREGIQSLWTELEQVDPESAGKLHMADTKRILRALEVYRETGKTISAHNAETAALPRRYDPVKIGLAFQDREDMKALIDQRVDKMVEEGLLEEVQALLRRGLPRTATALQAIGYKEFLGVLDGTATQDQAIEEVKLRSRQYAKRQLTWLRRDKEIHWIYWEKERDFDRALRLSTEILRAHGLC